MHTCYMHRSMLSYCRQYGVLACHMPVNASSSRLWVTMDLASSDSCKISNPQILKAPDV